MRIAVVGLLLLAVAGCSASKAGQGSIAAPDCSGGNVIQPSGAPYCYAQPAGFTQQSNADTGDEQWQAALKLSSGNAITSGVSAVDQSVGKLSDSQLLSATNHGAQNMGNGIVLQSPNGTMSKIPTGRSIVYQATVPVDGKKVNVDIYFVYGANVQFNLNCYWTTEQDRVKQACSVVLLTLKIKAAAQ
jgi:hypothetical protein